MTLGLWESKQWRACTECYTCCAAGFVATEHSEFYFSVKENVCVSVSERMITYMFITFVPTYWSVCFCSFLVIGSLFLPHQKECGLNALLSLWRICERNGTSSKAVTYGSTCIVLYFGDMENKKREERKEEETKRDRQPKFVLVDRVREFLITY